MNNETPAGPKADELLAMVAHELRAPLAAISNAVEILAQMGDDATMRVWAEGVMRRQTRQMSCVIEDMLQVFRILEGKAQLRKCPVDLAHVIALALETVRPCIDERRHKIDVSLPPAAVTVEADPILLEQVLTNLLGNAAKYTRPGGRIWLSVEAGCDTIALRIRDNGIGIVPEMLPHVFELFWQAPLATPHIQGGLGIGLALVREIVSMHGGSISAASDGPGLGSEFVVSLPRATPINLDEGTVCAWTQPAGDGRVRTSSTASPRLPVLGGT